MSWFKCHGSNVIFCVAKELISDTELMLIMYENLDGKGVGEGGWGGGPKNHLPYKFSSLICNQ